MGTSSRDSETSAHTTLAEPGAGKEVSEESPDVEKTAGQNDEVGELDGGVTVERDQDGVAIESGIPIVRLNGPDDPDR